MNSFIRFFFSPNFSCFTFTRFFPPPVSFLLSPERRSRKINLEIVWSKLIFNVFFSFQKVNLVRRQSGGGAVVRRKNEIFSCNFLIWKKKRINYRMFPVIGKWIFFYGFLIWENALKRMNSRNVFCYRKFFFSSIFSHFSFPVPGFRKRNFHVPVVARNL